MFKTARTHRCAVATRKFVKIRRVGLTLVVTITLLANIMVEGVGAIGTNAVANEDISNKF